MQLGAAVAAAWFATVIVGTSAQGGATAPGEHTTTIAALLTEMALTLGLVSVILGTASGAQNIGIIAAIGVGGYIALAGLWAAPLSGASMNPARSLGPDLLGGDMSVYWVYVVGPFVGATVAVALGFALRGTGGGRQSSLAAQGHLDPEIPQPSKP